MPQKAIERLMVLMFTDIVGSVHMKREVGSVAYQQRSSRHDEIFGEIVDGTDGAEIIKDTGDGFLARFETSSDAVLASQHFQRRLAAEDWGVEPMRVRIGIHVGEVSEMGVDALGAPKIVGLAADIAARVMGLALPGQTLLTRTPFDDARQYIGDRLVSVDATCDRAGDPADEAAAARLKWMAHGAYMFKGNDEPVAVFEVGIEELAPLRPPPDSEKAQRAVTAKEEALLGWRPAKRLEVPSRKGWVLEKKLGEGGFGEVWLAVHEQTSDTRVFKFCFDAEKLQSFKRELTLFRLIRRTLGERADIAKLHEIQLDHPPYFLESEYTASGDLAQWSRSLNGIAEIPLETRLDLVVRTAGAVAAAHSVGILHKDIKPSNILIYKSDDGQFRPRLADFGIGMITDRSKIDAQDITMSGFTETAMLEDDASRTGTRVYAPPESLMGQPFTIQGDVYALGVLLYQMVVGELERPLGAGWERDIESPELLDDIARCVDHDPERRLRNATELAERLRNVESRRLQRRQTTRRTRVRRIAVGASAVLVVVATLLVLHVGRISRERDRANREAATASEVSEFLVGLFDVSDPGEARGNSITAREILDRGADRIVHEMKAQPRVQGRLLTTMGRVYHELGLYDEARPLLDEASTVLGETKGDTVADLGASLQYKATLLREIGDYDAAREAAERSLALREEAFGPDHPEVASSLNELALLLSRVGDYERARALFERTLQIRERALGEEHPQFAEVLNNLGLLLDETGDNAGALELYERALRIQESTLAPDHPRLATTLNNLANAYKRGNNFEAALPLYERALRIAEKVLGPDHADVAINLNNLAVLRKSMGDYAGAEPFYRRALEIHENALGSEHFYVGADLNNIAGLLSAKGEYGRAQPLAERAVAIMESSFGPDHPYVAGTLDTLGHILWKKGEAGRAKPIFERVLAIQEKAYGEQHTEVATTLISLGELSRELGRPEDAVPLLERAVAIRENTQGSDHPDSAATRAELTALRLSLGQGS